MKLDELKAIIRRLYREHIKYHLKVILLCLVLSIIVAASSSATAWIQDTLGNIFLMFNLIAGK